MLKQAVVLLWAIGRARAGHDRLLGWADTVAALTPLLETHRRDGERRQGRPDYPIAALFHAGLWDLPGHADLPRAHGDAAVRTWFAEHAPEGGLPWSVHALARRSGSARVRMIDAITARFFEDFDESGRAAVGLYDEDVATDEAPPSGGSGQETVPRSIREGSRAEYARLCELVARRESRTYGQRRARTVNDPIRISTARRAVLMRSGGRCENPRCAKPASYRNDRGEALLEVDHIEQRQDYPIQMIALCPDCHRVKTHGQSRHQLIPVLAQRARELHGQWITADG